MIHAERELRAPYRLDARIGHQAAVHVARLAAEVRLLDERARAARAAGWRVAALNRRPVGRVERVEVVDRAYPR